MSVTNETLFSRNLLFENHMTEQLTKIVNSYGWWNFKFFLKYQMMFVMK